MTLQVSYDEFRNYMDERKDSYSVKEEGDKISISFEGSSPTVVEKLGKPVTVFIYARKDSGMVIFEKMQVIIGEEVYDADVSSLESWLIEITGRI
ncbi:MAG: hypothetical protein QXX17_01295 [Conexivisphaerales archaeon]